MSVMVVTGYGQLTKRREAMVVPKAAFRVALSMLPAPGLYEDALDLADAYIGAHPDVPKPVRIIWDSAVEFGRLYPEVEVYGPVMLDLITPGNNNMDGALDALFTLAKAVDDKNEAEMAAAVAGIMEMIG